MSMRKPTQQELEALREDYETLSLKECMYKNKIWASTLYQFFWKKTRIKYKKKTFTRKVKPIPIEKTLLPEMKPHDYHYYDTSWFEIITWLKPLQWKH